VVRWLAKTVILLSQRIPVFAARGGYSGLSAAPDPTDRFAKSEIELEDHQNFLANLSTLDFGALIGGRLVLDYGSGFGGRAVWMAASARQVEGVEIHLTMVEQSNQFAAMKGATNVRFTMGSEERILFADNYFDVVVSFDVLEHVERPDTILKELHRVLKPGGTAVLIFTPYYGLFSHHLNYISLFPGLHWIFSADTLIDAVNELLAQPEFARLGMDRRPPPHLSYNGKRLCLPSLNGLTRREYVELVRALDLRVVHMRATPILERYRILGAPGAALNRALSVIPGLDEAVSYNLVSILRKAGSS
jgi:SAM-dependent methyltransferase